MPREFMPYTAEDDEEKIQVTASVTSGKISSQSQTGHQFDPEQVRHLRKICTSSDHWSAFLDA